MKRTVLFLFLLAGCATMVMQHGVPNLRQVDPGVWRGGEPTPEGWAYLKSIGVSNVVKLNTVDEASDSNATEIGMTVHYFPIDTFDQLFATPASTVSNAVAAITLGTYVHCEHGQDRTGVVCARYRVVRDGWTKAAAEKEMLANGFHKSLRGLWEYWEDQP